MKLMLCGYCKDIVALDVAEMRACRCGQTKGQYRDDHWHADIWGDDCVLLGLKNDDLYPLLAARNSAAGDRCSAELEAQPPWHPRAHYREGDPD